MMNFSLPQPRPPTPSPPKLLNEKTDKVFVATFRRITDSKYLKRRNAHKAKAMCTIIVPFLFCEATQRKSRLVFSRPPHPPSLCSSDSVFSANKSESRTEKKRYSLISPVALPYCKLLPN